MFELSLRIRCGEIIIHARQRRSLLGENMCKGWDRVYKRQRGRIRDQRCGSRVGMGVMWVPGGHCRALPFTLNDMGSLCSVMSRGVIQSGL